MNGIAKERPTIAPEIGQHSVEILTSLGYQTGAIEDLMNRGVIGTER